MFTKPLLTILAALVLVSPATAGTRMLDGFATGEVSTDPGFLADSAKHGDSAVLIPVDWPGAPPSRAYVDTIVAQTTRARALGLGPLLRFASVAAHAPLTASARVAYCDFVRDLSDRLGVWRVSIWNEPNGQGFTFWPNTGHRAKDYARLLETCWPRLRDAHRVVVGELAPNDGYSAGFVRHLGKALGQRKAFDTFSTHPYPARRGAEPVDATHPDGRYAVGDYARLVADTRAAFPWRPDLYYTETGWWSSRLGAVAQCRHLYDAWRLARSQPLVHAFLNYRWADAGWWTTGVAQKPAAAATEGWKLGQRGRCS